MSQRKSGYSRKLLDIYQTPAWVTEALIPHIPRLADTIWEPAAGDGQMVDVLRRLSGPVIGTDIRTGCDFLKYQHAPDVVEAIITNPPFNLAYEFICKAMNLMFNESGFIAMLLRADYDSADSRRNIFAASSIFCKKVVLTKRIVWIERTDGIKAAPSYNHAWYIWDWQNKGAPTLAWGP